MEEREWTDNVVEMGKSEGKVDRNQVVYDDPDQLAKIVAALLPGEQVEGVFDMKGGSTGFLGITDKRIIYFDKSFMGKSRAFVSIPYSQILSVASEVDEGFMARGFRTISKLVLTTSAESREFEFRGADKSRVAERMILRHMI